MGSGMKSPFADGGALARAIPWISMALGVVLAARTTTAHVPGIVKLLAWCAAATVVVACVRRIADR